MDPILKESLVKIHGLLMTFVWLFVVPLGIAFNIYGRKMQKSWGVKAHMVTMMIAGFVPFSIAAITGLTASGSIKLKPHSATGTILVILTWIQMIMGAVNHGVFRYRKKNNNIPATRPWNNHVHIWLGRVLLLVANINIVLGMRMKQLDLSIYIIHGIWLFFLACLFLYLFCMKPVQTVTVSCEKPIDTID
ncbi:hypothetical protein BDB01DRAFT_258609 [Pilobolus umbonatus]|nr:hypothetical protein BDB01DRAFT_258609 [Pilobolus umbonatus]